MAGKHINFEGAIITDCEGQSYRVESAEGWGEPQQCEMDMDLPAEYAIVGDAFDGMLFPHFVSQHHLFDSFFGPNSAGSPDTISFV